MCLDICWKTTEALRADLLAGNKRYTDGNLCYAYKVLLQDGRAPIQTNFRYKPGRWITYGGVTVFFDDVRRPPLSNDDELIRSVPVQIQHVYGADYPREVKYVCGPNLLHAYLERDIAESQAEYLGEYGVDKRIVRVAFKPWHLFACSANRQVGLLALYITVADWNAAGLTWRVVPVRSR